MHLYWQTTTDSKRGRLAVGKKLHEALRSDSAICCTKFFVELPTADQHNNHVLGEVSSWQYYQCLSTEWLLCVFVTVSSL